MLHRVFFIIRSPSLQASRMRMVGLLFLLGIESTCKDMGTIITQYIVVSRERRKNKEQSKHGNKKTGKNSPDS